MGVPHEFNFSLVCKQAAVAASSMSTAVRVSAPTASYFNGLALPFGAGESLAFSSLAQMVGRGGWWGVTPSSATAKSGQVCYFIIYWYSVSTPLCCLVFAAKDLCRHVT